MNLKQRLKDVRGRYHGEFMTLSEFSKSTEKSLTRKQKRKPKVKLSDDDRDSIHALGKFLEESVEGKGPDSIEIQSKAASEFLMHFIMPIKHQGFLSDMTLSHLIAFQEAMQKDYLRAILMSRKEVLKSSAKITYEEALSHRSVKSLHEALVAKEVDQLGYGSIDDVAYYFKDKFNIMLSDFEKWDNIGGCPIHC